MADDPRFLWCCDPQTVDPLPGLPYLRRVASQEAREAYHIVPAGRSHGFAIFQYTLAGGGLFHDARGERRIGPGCGFLCHSDDGTIRYRHPGRGHRPWTFVYATWFCAAETVAAIAGHDPLFRIARGDPLVRDLEAFAAQARPVLSAARSAELAVRIITALAQHRPSRRPPPSSGFVEQVLALAHDGARPLNVGELAARLRCSREHLSRRFRAEAGEPLRDTLLRLRLQRACELLRSPEEPEIAAIAERCGFSDVGHLARRFRHAMGTTPSRYRRLALRDQPL